MVPSVPFVAQKTSTGTASTVRAEMARRGIKGRQLATQVGIPERTLRRRLAGHVPFTAEELAAVAVVLGVPVANLIAGRDAA